MGFVNVMVISTSSPVNGPALVNGRTQPAPTQFTTVLFAVKAALRILAEIESVPANPSRVAVSISTSEGELTRVGTKGVLKTGDPEVRATSESKGKTWYTSTSTSLMLPTGVPVGTSPVIVALLMTVVSGSTKSSAVSVSIFPGLGRRESAPSTGCWVLGLPVSKKKLSAESGAARHAVKISAAPIMPTREYFSFKFLN